MTRRHGPKTGLTLLRPTTISWPPRSPASAPNWRGWRGGQTDDQNDRMVKISALIADLITVRERYGDTCVYIRRGGMAWGSVALNREADDKKHGVFDLQAQHDRDMQRMAEIVERWRADRKAAEACALAAEARMGEVVAMLDAESDDKLKTLWGGCREVIRAAHPIRPRQGDHVMTLWQMCRECNRYRWRAIVAYVACLAIVPFVWRRS